VAQQRRRWNNNGRGGTALTGRIEDELPLCRCRYRWSGLAIEQRRGRWMAASRIEEFCARGRRRGVKPNALVSRRQVVWAFSAALRRYLSRLRGRGGIFIMSVRHCAVKRRAVASQSFLTPLARVALWRCRALMFTRTCARRPIYQSFAPILLCFCAYNAASEHCSAVGARCICFQQNINARTSSSLSDVILAVIEYHALFHHHLCDGIAAFAASRSAQAAPLVYGAASVG